MGLIRNAIHVARLECGLFGRFPKLRLSVLGIVFIPALYAFIYLDAVWDPASRTRELPALIVNLDQGADFNGQHFRIGADLTQQLLDKGAFGFRTLDDEQQARRMVREGRSLLALVIPADFSASALSAHQAGAGKLIVFASEGNDYAGAGFAKRFAAELGHQVNETLNEKRWAAVLGATASSADSLQRLRDGVAQLRAGAHTLDDGLAKAAEGGRQLGHGSQQLAGHVGTLTDGVQQLGAGVRQLDARKPAPADLAALREGAQQLSAGHVQLSKALPALRDGAGQLQAGASQMREETQEIPFVGGKVAEGAGKLADGAGQLQGGLGQVIDAQARLKAGARTLSQGVGQLTEGFAAYAGGVSTLAAKWPADASLGELAAGSEALSGAAGQLGRGLAELKSGSARLALGVDTLAGSLPASVPSLPGTPRGLADSVEPLLEIDAPVASNGMGFAPNFIPVALWLGAVMTAFVFHLRRLPEAARDHSRLSLMLGKMGVLGSINIAQAVAVLVMAWVALGLRPVHVAGLALTMVLMGLTFMLVILLLVRAFGDVGKALALILLIVQLSSAGGVMPIELTSEFYRAVSPWLPFTWAVHGVRASAFGAFNNDWFLSVGVLALFALGALLLSLLVGRWRFVGPDEHRPAMDI